MKNNLVYARRQVRVARRDLYLAKVRLLRAMRTAEELLYAERRASPMISKQAG